MRDWVTWGHSANCRNKELFKPVDLRGPGARSRGEQVERS